ncbi:MAG: hypothetical protein KAG14_04605 [Mycoplasmataceae bacterium]|nr:hypothetical protein [Mycoplasmataceae bacterium]
MKVLVTFIDIKNSTSITDLDKKKDMINTFYKYMNKITLKEGTLEIKDKVYLGDGVIIFCKANDLDSNDLNTFLQAINKQVVAFENDSGEELKVGMSYGEYGDVQIYENAFSQKAIFVAPCFDYSSKASNLALTFSIPEKYVVIGKKAFNIQTINNKNLIDLLKLLHEENFIQGKESRASRNYRFEVEY